MKIKSNFKFNKDRNENKEINNIEFRKNKFKRSVNCVGKVTIIMTITVTSSILILTCLEGYKKYAIGDKNSVGYVAQLNFSKRLNQFDDTNSFGSVSDAVVIVKSGEDKEVGLYLEDEGYVIASTKSLSDKENIYVKVFKDAELKGEFIGEDPKHGVAVIKVNLEEPVNKRIIHNNFALKRISKEGQRAKFIDSELRSQKITINDNNVKINGKFIDINFKNNNGNNNDSTIVICDEDGKILGMNFLDGNKGAQDFFYSSLHTYELKDIIENIIDENYNRIKQVGIIGKNAIPSTKDGVQGVYIQRVITKSSVEEAGIRPTDIITGAQHKNISNIEELGQSLSKYKKGDEVIIKLFRNGKTIYRRIKIR